MAKKMCGEERLVVVERVHWWSHGSLVVVERVHWWSHGSLHI